MFQIPTSTYLTFIKFLAIAISQPKLVSWKWIKLFFFKKDIRKEISITIYIYNKHFLKTTTCMIKIKKLKQCANNIITKINYNKQ